MKKYLSSLCIPLTWVICIEREKLLEIEKAVNHLFTQNAMTTGEVILVCEVVKQSWIAKNLEDELVRKYGLTRVEGV